MLEELVAVCPGYAVEIEEGFADGFEMLEVLGHIVFIFHKPL